MDDLPNVLLKVEAPLVLNEAREKAEKSESSVDTTGCRLDCTQSLSFLVHSNRKTGASERYSRTWHSSLARGRASRSLQSLNYSEKRKGLRVV